MASRIDETLQIAKRLHDEYEAKGGRPDERATNWQFVLNIPDDYTVTIIQNMLECMCVPLAYIVHRFDIKEDGTPAKPHFHVLVGTSRVMSRRQLGSLLVSVGLWDCVDRHLIHVTNDRVAMCRYLIHLDNPEKHLYSASEIVTLFGYQLCFTTAFTPEQTQATLRDICAFVLEEGITEYADLVGLSIAQHPDWSKLVLKDYAYGLKQFIDGLRYKQKGFHSAVATGYADVYTGEYYDCEV